MAGRLRPEDPIDFVSNFLMHYEELEVRVGVRVRVRSSRLGQMQPVPPFITPTPPPAALGIFSESHAGCHHPRTPSRSLASSICLILRSGFKPSRRAVCALLLTPRTKPEPPILTPKPSPQPDPTPSHSLQSGVFGLP